MHNSKQSKIYLILIYSDADLLAIFIYELMYYVQSYFTSKSTSYWNISDQTRMNNLKGEFLTILKTYHTNVQNVLGSNTNTATYKQNTLISNRTQMSLIIFQIFSSE